MTAACPQVDDPAPDRDQKEHNRPDELAPVLPVHRGMIPRQLAPIRAIEVRSSDLDAHYRRPAGIECPMNPAEFVTAFGESRAAAIIRTARTSDARAAMDAAVQGGFRICEFTLSVPDALELITEFAARPGLVVGAGTVLTAEDARAAVDAGASFLVSPVVDEAVIAEAARLGVGVVRS